MKATDTLLSTIIIGVTLIIMTGCSQSEDLIDAGAQALNAATYHDRKSRKGFLFFCAKKRANFPALSKSFLKKFPKTLPYLHFSA